MHTTDKLKVNFALVSLNDSRSRQPKVFQPSREQGSKTSTNSWALVMELITTNAAVDGNMYMLCHEKLVLYESLYSTNKMQVQHTIPDVSPTAYETKAKGMG